MLEMEMQAKKGPNPDELLVLLEKQDVMLESLMIEVQTCRDEVDRLRRENIQIQKETDQLRNDHISTIDKLKEAVDLLESQKNVNSTLEREIDEMRHASNLLNPFGKTLEFEGKIRELEFALERERRMNETIRNENDYHSQRNTELKHELEDLRKLQKSTLNETKSRIESLHKEVADEKLKNQLLQKDQEERIGKLTVEIEFLKEREQFFETQHRLMASENEEIKKEKYLSSNRLRTLHEENLILREKLLRLSTMDDSNLSTHGIKAHQKLIEDQAHLISTLQEECRLLAGKLENDRRDFRERTKGLLNAKRDLEKRLESLLLIEDQIR